MIDQVKIIIRAGNGGDGVIHFRRGRFLPKGGPDGGDGGKGGDVYIVTDPNLATLSDFARRQRFEAESGRNGGGNCMTGASSEDLEIRIPVGTTIKVVPQSGIFEYSKDVRQKAESNSGDIKVMDFDKSDLRVLIAKGGKGGKGNWHFKSSTNTTPRQATNGEMGESYEMEMSLKLLADVGLIGLPNAGKSTLLSVLSEARPKIADYPFTTLEPNLGVLRLTKDKSVVLADIPGLIEGASTGRGLGIKFLQHIERTRVLVHLLAADVDNVEEVVRNYQLVRKELEQYGAGLAEKIEIVVLNKIDLVDEKKLKEIQDVLEKKGIKTLAISCGTLAGVAQLRKRLGELV